MRQEGFTLVELVVVVAIIGILTGVAVPNYTRMREQKYISLLESSLYSMERSLEAIRASSGDESYPIHVSVLNEPTSPNYTPCSSFTGDLAMVCSTLPLFPATAPRSDFCMGGSYEIPSYVYISDGVSYKILAHCSGASQAIYNSKLRDPARPTWAVSITNNHAATDSW